MKKIYFYLLICLLTGLNFVNAQVATNNCNNSLLTAQNKNFGNFEAGDDNISPLTAGSDLHPRLQLNGSYQIVSNVSQLGGGGYLNIKPFDGGSFLAAHTSTTTTDRIWFSNMTVNPGDSYSFCVNTTLLKNLSDGSNFIVGLYANGEEIGRGRVTFNWTEICGIFTVPEEVNCVELSLRDPVKGLFFLAIDGISIKNNTPFMGVKMSNPNNIFNSSSFKMYSNPANNNVTIQLPATIQTNATITITNAAGKMVYNKTVNKAGTQNLQHIPEVSNLSSGLYFVTINTDGRITNQKLVIAH